jgi:hypothetical protein
LIYISIISIATITTKQLIYVCYLPSKLINISISIILFYSSKNSSVSAYQSLIIFYLTHPKSFNHFSNNQPPSHSINHHSLITYHYKDSTRDLQLQVIFINSGHVQALTHTSHHHHHELISPSSFTITFQSQSPLLTITFMISSAINPHINYLHHSCPSSIIFNYHQLLISTSTITINYIINYIVSSTIHQHYYLFISTTTFYHHQQAISINTIIFNHHQSLLLQSLSINYQQTFNHHQLSATATNRSRTS